MLSAFCNLRKIDVHLIPLPQESEKFPVGGKDADRENSLLPGS